MEIKIKPKELPAVPEWVTIIMNLIDEQMKEQNAKSRKRKY